MSAPALVRWAISPRDGCPHAFDPQQLDGFADRGYAEAVCGHDVNLGCPIDVNTPSGAVCASCALTVAPDVEDRAAMLAGFGDPVVLS